MARPRSERARTVILEAAGELMISGGLTAATIEGVATRAGVSKATIYRWWPSRGALALDGFLHHVQESIEPPSGATMHEALQHQVDALVHLVRDTDAGPLLRALTAQSESDADVAAALRDRWFAPRREAAALILAKGIEGEELRPDTDIDLAVDQLFAPIYHRLLYRHDPLPDDFATALIDQLLRGIATSEFPPSTPSENRQVSHHGQDRC